MSAGQDAVVACRRSEHTHGDCLRPQRVVVAVATYARLDHIRRLLPKLVEQVERADFHATILVIDNNRAPDARIAVTELRHAQIRYVHEPRPGITAARNQAIDQATDADALVFIDDDESPSSGWLSSLVDCWIEWQCAAVTGPVISEFLTAPTEWVNASGTFDRRSLPSGQMVDGAASNNLLLDLRWLRDHAVRFDDRFGLSGGSDTMLTRQIRRIGGDIRWCDEAEVSEIVPGHRLTRNWILRRTLRTSNDWSRVHLVLAGGGWRRELERVNLLIRSAYRVAIGSLVLITVGLIVRPQRYRAVCQVVAGLGMASGAVGIVRSEYSRSEGR